MSNNKQSSVEWLVEKLGKYNEEMVFLYQNEIEQAKAMQREDMIGLLEWMNEIAKTDPMRLETDKDDIVDMYYNETFNNNEQQ